MGGGVGWSNGNGGGGRDAEKRLPISHLLVAASSAAPEQATAGRTAGQAAAHCPLPTAQCEKAAGGDHARRAALLLSQLLSAGFRCPRTLLDSTRAAEAPLAVMPKRQPACHMSPCAKQRPQSGRRSLHRATPAKGHGPPHARCPLKSSRSLARRSAQLCGSGGTALPGAVGRGAREAVSCKNASFHCP